MFKLPAKTRDSRLASLEQDVRTCGRCNLHTTRTNPVFGRGKGSGELMLMGESPGEIEDRTGIPFRGAAGGLLIQAIASAGVTADVRALGYVTNIMKCRPPLNRDPEPGEVSACLPFLQQQIEILRPRVILVMGRIAAHHFLLDDRPLSRIVGTIRTYTPHTLAMVTYHPAWYLHKRTGAHALVQHIKQAVELVGVMRQLLDGVRYRK